MADEYVLPQKVIEQLKEELKELRTTGRTDIAEKIKEAKSFGDLSENSEYDEAKNEQAEIEGKIAHLEETLKNVVLIDEKDIKTDVISVGCKVKLYDLTLDEESEYTIVGSTECDPFNNKISDESPLGKALLGQREGDNINVETPIGVDKYNIISISRM